jgi:hypothetical protein
LTGFAARPIVRNNARNRKKTMRSALILIAVLTAGTALAADSAYSPEARGIVAPDDGKRLPLCSHPSLFTTIASDFEDKERGYWHSGARLTSFEEPVELGYRPWGPEFIPRRFCRTRAMVSAGTVHDVYYSVGYQTGTLGIVHDVIWCVDGYDRNLAYAPGCKMAGP